MQRTHATTLMLASALALAATRILLTITSVIFVAMQMGPRSFGGLQYFTYMVSNLLWGMQGALLPAMIAMLLMIGTRDEAYRRAFSRQ